MGGVLIRLIQQSFFQLWLWRLEGVMVGQAQHLLFFVFQRHVQGKIASEADNDLTFV